METPPKRKAPTVKPVQLGDTRPLGQLGRGPLLGLGGDTVIQPELAALFSVLVSSKAYMSVRNCGVLPSVGAVIPPHIKIELPQDRKRCPYRVP